MAYKAVVAIGASSDFVRNKDVDGRRINRDIDRKRRVVGQYSGGTFPKIRGCDFIAVGKVCCNGKMLVADTPTVRDIWRCTSAHRVLPAFPE